MDSHTFKSHCTQVNGDIAKLCDVERKRIRHHVMLLWITTIFLGWVPAICILLKGSFHDYVKANAKQALNLFLSICLYILCFVALTRFMFKYSEGLGVSLLGGGM